VKILHLGDLHLGKSLGDYNLGDDQRFILDEILEIINENAVDAVLVAGDVYDRAVPSEEATNLFNDFLNELAASNVAAFIISGNHDSDDRLNFGSKLFSSNQIFISAKFDGKLYCKTVTDEFGEVNIYLLPFVKASQVKNYYPEAKIESYEDAVRTIIEAADIDNAKRNIIVAHQFVAGGTDPELSGSEGIGTQSVGTVEKISYKCFYNFDYVALGHIHHSQRIGRDTVRYSGSPLKYSLSEADADKSVPIITLKEKGSVEVELVKLVPKRDLRHIKGEMKMLLDKKNVVSPDDFIYATLTDEDTISDAMSIFQQTYPNTVKIEYENSHTLGTQQVDITRIAENKPFDELIKEFYFAMYGCEMSEDEMDIMLDAAKKAGVQDEAD
jgi:exonuclease SbcD